MKTQKSYDEELEEKIKQTGFILEHQVAEMFEKAGWGIIHNRYYIDDVVPQQREIDLLAYKVDESIPNFRIVTCLIVSCKKSEQYDWIFLTRKAPSMGSNINMNPITINSNVGVFNYEVTITDWKKEKSANAGKFKGLLNKLFSYPDVIFAFKEFKYNDTKTRSDSAIFDSISSLVKAQAYEIKSLKTRRKPNETYVYNFNLLSIADVKFFKLHFEGDNYQKVEINRINYLNRFLINGIEQHSKVEFLTFESLPELIKDYDLMHEWNIEFYMKSIEEFYNNIWEKNRKDYIIKIEGEKFLQYLKNKAKASNLIEFYFSVLYLEYEDNVLRVDCNVTDSINKTLNEDKTIKTFTSQWLKKHFKYSGEFIFKDAYDLPF